MPGGRWLLSATRSIVVPAVSLTPGLHEVDGLHVVRPRERRHFDATLLVPRLPRRQRLLIECRRCTVVADWDRGAAGGACVRFRAQANNLSAGLLHAATALAYIEIRVFPLPRGAQECDTLPRAKASALK